MSIVHTTSSSYILYDQFEIILGWILYKALITTHYKLLDFFIVIFFNNKISFGNVFNFLNYTFE